MRRTWTILLFLLVSSQCVAQNSQEPENLLYKQIQRFADTTYVIEVSNSGTFANHGSHYLLSKKDTLINIYYYGEPLKGIVMPKEIAGRLKYAAALDTAQVALNLRFSPERISKENGLKFWNGLKMLEPWRLKEVGKEKCPQIYDGWTLRFSIIVKDNITTLRFYNPDSHEKSCPGNLDRQTILKIYDMFLSFFGRK